MTNDDITTCQVKNQHDDLLMTLFTEWLDSEGLKITIFSEKSTSLVGQMKLTNVDEFAKNLSKTRSEYLELTRSILSGKETGVEFILKDSKLRWKKGPWNHGIINMAESRMEQVFPDVVKKLLLQNSNLEKTVDEIRMENEDLRIAQRELNEKVEKIIAAKNELEDHLYKRFIIVLNSKKERIRELQSKLNRGIETDGKKKEDKIYEAETDQSEEEEEGEEKVEGEGKEVVCHKEKTKNNGDKAEPSMFLNRVFSNVEIFGEEKLLKRQMSESEEKMIDSDYENDDKMKRNGKYLKEEVNKSQRKTKRVKSMESTPAKASTSRNSVETDKEKDKGEKNRSIMLNFESGESEEDIFADDS